ncbi:hypothetical protein EVAR_38839_1 [Eumeta japonica]|uniref:Uncharacterized protein n=1 Tax=Eumeta variegata TaxID=151549 RepID=A0A4C1XQR4_EUMVA|nr:hypothetical protein EVAR_38839_1 [Eumeta japonica]
MMQVFEETAIFELSGSFAALHYIRKLMGNDILFDGSPPRAQNELVAVPGVWARFRLGPLTHNTPPREQSTRKR